MSPIINNASLMYEVINKMDYMVRVMDSEQKVIYMNKKMSEVFSYTIGHICYELLGRNEKCDHCVTLESKETGQPVTKDVAIGDKYYKVMSSPVSIDNGQSYSIEILHDITEQKETEFELLKHYEKLKSDIEFAKHIQNRTLPIDGEYWDSIRTSSAYLPSEDLGGDLFDIIKASDNETLLYIADISGHGIRSSLLTIFLRQLIRGRTYERTIDLKEIIDDLVKSFNELGIDEEYYLSVLFCYYDKIKKEVTMLNAGHNCLPIVIKKDGTIEEIQIKGMPVCSLINKSNHEQLKIKVESGDRIILYTDGITEVYNKKTKKPYGSEGITRAIKENPQLKGKALIDKIIEEVKDSGNITPIDDMAIMVAEIL